MTDHVTHPTPYPEVNAALHALLSGVQSLLGERLTGMYLHGSLAGGDFDLQHSDIDFLIVTNGELPDEMFPALEELHARLAASIPKWGAELEGSYIPQGALQRYDPAHALHPYIERGGRLRLEQHDSDWVIQRHVIRERGVVITGPHPKTLIDPVGPGDLKKAVLETLQGWWAPMLEEPFRLHHSGYQAYAALTMCRILYTLRFGKIASKPTAARWAQQSCDKRWRALIERALDWKLNQEDVDETLDFIRYTLEQNLSG